MSETSRPFSRKDVRAVIISALRRVKADPRSLSITAGQRAHITRNDR